MVQIDKSKIQILLEDLLFEHIRFFFHDRNCDLRVFFFEGRQQMREQGRTAHDGKADIEMALINTGVKISRIDQNVVTFQEVDRFLVKDCPASVSFCFL